MILWFVFFSNLLSFICSFSLPFLFFLALFYLCLLLCLPMSSWLPNLWCFIFVMILCFMFFSALFSLLYFLSVFFFVLFHYGSLFCRAPFVNNSLFYVLSALFFFISSSSFHAPIFAVFINFYLFYPCPPLLPLCFFPSSLFFSDSGLCSIPLSFNLKVLRFPLSRLCCLLSQWFSHCPYGVLFSALLSFPLVLLTRILIALQGFTS